MTDSGAESSIRSQFATSNISQGPHLKYLPYAFTEQDIAKEIAAILMESDALEQNVIC